MTMEKVGFESPNRTKLTVRIAKKMVEAQDICTYELVHAEGKELPEFEAGAHIDVHLAPGLVRQYSLCNAPRERWRYLIGVLRDPRSRGGSARMHDDFAEGHMLDIGMPRSLFALDDAGTHSILVAGGIGITPIICMAESLAAAGRGFELHYCTRSPERTAFRKHIADSTFAGSVHFHFDDGDAAQKLDLGRILDAPSTGTHLYVCGPAGFLDAVVGAAGQFGWPEARIHHESFSGGVPAGDVPEKSFVVMLARSGRKVTVNGNASITSALVAAGVTVETSCEQGFCGTCLARVIEGQPDHRDSFLTSGERAAGDQMLLCCSRSKSPTLVLDL